MACDKIVEERTRFVGELTKISGFKVFPSQANYVLVKLENGMSSNELAVKLLDDDNIFIKDLSSKKGFDNGQYIRLAVRDNKDNDRLLAALKNL